MKEKAFKYIVDVQHKQIAITDVFTSIKEVKAELKGASFSVPVYIEELNELFKSKRSFFVSKLQKYSSTFNSNKEWVKNPTVPDGFSYLSGNKFPNVDISIWQYNIEHDQRKLEKIIAILKRILDYSELGDIAEFYKLEKEFTNPWAIISERHSSFYLIDQIFSENDELSNLLSQLRKKLKYLLCFRYTKVCRDLRQLFRNIVRFLFKNMSDESGEGDFSLYARYRQKSLTFLNHNTHDFRRNCQTIKSFT